jgi:hypothetical protein
VSLPWPGLPAPFREEGLFAGFVRGGHRHSGGFRAVPPASAPAIPAILFWTGRRRTDTGSNARLGPESPEQAETRLIDDLELGLGFVHAQAIQGGIFGFLYRPSGRLDPLHCLPAPSITLAAAAGAAGTGASGPRAVWSATLRLGRDGVRRNRIGGEGVR